MTEFPQVEFSPTDDEADAKVRNDELIDTLLEYTLLDICTPYIMERLARSFLDGTFFIPTDSLVQSVPHLPADNVAKYFNFILLKDNGENYLPFYTDISQSVPCWVM
jgi:hypothetical protein